MGKLEGSVTPVRFGSEASGALTPLTSLSPMDPIPTPCLWGMLTPQVPSREVQSLIYYDQEGQYKEATDLLNWKHHTHSFTERPQALI
jgi:hypothetical protein